jgi:hypothetical protein
MDVLTSRTFSLGSTKSYSAREAQWFGKDANGEGGVIIRLWDQKRRSRGTNSGRHGFESDFYEVSELPPLPGVLARHFALINKADDGQKFVYRVLVGANKSCTCKCGLCHQYECKHEAAVEAALDSGFWDGLDDDPAPDDGVETPGEPTAFELSGAL